MITSAMTLSPTEVQVSWSEVNPIDRNGFIILYEVDYQPLRDFETEVTRVNSTGTTTVLVGLHESVPYNITVRAYTAVGGGPFSNPGIGHTNESSKHITEYRIY